MNERELNIEAMEKIVTIINRMSVTVKCLSKMTGLSYNAVRSIKTKKIQLTYGQYVLMMTALNEIIRFREKHPNYCFQIRTPEQMRREESILRVHARNIDL